MDRDVYLIKTEKGFAADHATEHFTNDPDQAISFIHIDAAAERAREFSYLQGIRCTLHVHKQQIPRPLSLTSHGTQISKVLTGD